MYNTGEYHPRKNPVVKKTVKLGWFKKWLERKISWKKRMSPQESRVYLTGFDCILKVENNESFPLYYEDQEVFGGYIPENIDWGPIDERLYEYPVVFLTHSSRADDEYIKACLLHELGHHLCGHTEDWDEYTPHEILQHEIQAWKRAIDIWSLLSDKKFPNSLAYNALESYGRFAPDIDYKTEIKNYVKENL